MQRSSGGRPPRPTRSRRTALCLAAVAGITASPLLTACGSTPHPGAAAVVGDERITVSQVQSQVRDVRRAQADSAQAAQMMKGTGQLSRATLNSLIFDKVLGRAAEDAGVHVNRADAQKALSGAQRSAGGAKQLRQMWLQQYAIGPGQVEQTVRNQVLMEKLSKALGVDSSQPGGQQRLVAALQKASKELGVDVNPRFGAWDGEKVLLGSVKEPWLRSVTGEAEQEQL